VGLRFGLVGLMAATFVGCTLLVDSGGLAGPDKTSLGPPDAADASDGSASERDAGADANDGAPPLHPYVQAVVADGPSLYYRLEEASEGPAKDEMGKHPGVYLSGGDHAVPGVFSGSKALHLSGTGGIDAGDIFDFEGKSPYTLETWFRPEAYDMQYRFLFHHDDERGPRQNYGIYVQSTNGIGFERYVDDDGLSARVPTPPAVGSWHHIVGVYDGELIQLFVDGTLIQASPDNRAAKDKQSILRIGFGYDGGGGVPLGTLDEVAIYEKALTEERITAHFQAAR
jgi:Concanavalin A-like lectin/glucanases superfamily